MTLVWWGFYSVKSEMGSYVFLSLILDSVSESLECGIEFVSDVLRGELKPFV